MLKFFIYIIFPIFALGCSKAKTVKRFDENKQIYIEYQIKNNRNDGYYKEFYDNRTLKYIVQYKNGKRDGRGIAYYKNGNVNSISNYEDDSVNGVTLIYYENGYLNESQEIKKDKINGLVKSYFKDGHLNEILSYKNNEEDGLRKIYFHNGALQLLAGYHNGSTLFEIHMDSLGKVNLIYKDLEISSTDDTITIGANLNLKAILYGPIIKNLKATLFYLKPILNEDSNTFELVPIKYFIGNETFANMTPKDTGTYNIKFYVEFNGFSHGFTSFVEKKITVIKK